MNFMKEARPMFSGTISAHEFVLKLKRAGRLVLQDISMLFANGKITKVEELYPGKSAYTACFLRKGDELKLLTLGSKTVTEIKAVGYDRYNNSRVPFLVTLHINEHGAKQIVPVNLQIHPSHLLTTNQRRVYADQDSEWGSGEEPESPELS